MSFVTRSHGDQAVTQKVPSARPRWAAGDGPGQRASTSELEAAYETFFRTHFTNVTRTVHLIVHDRARAEDIAQDAFLQLFRDWPRIAAYERPEAWLRRVAIPLAVRGLRRDALWSRVRGLFLPRLAPAPADPDVLEAVGRLPRAQRVAIVLHYYEDRPVAEIAALLGCGEATARVHLHRGRRRLAELLGEEGPDAPRR
jgi:RNA polymerase sigma-70 factor (ECF subfamily)